MIFVTVGTTGPFDELLQEVDRLAGADVFGEHVICQGGQSKYRMRHGEQFVARPSIADLIADSSLVISHGGSTVTELLRARKPFVAFPNPRLADDHQTIFLQQIAAIADISWSRDVADLAPLYKERRARGPASLRADLPRAGDIIRQLWNG
ncbi:MAG: glycosyltransferase [Acetobacteraceae bacterium]